MVAYMDSGDRKRTRTHTGSRARRLAPRERQEKAREKNRVLTGTAAIEGARNVALRQLDARMRSRKQLRDAILHRGFSPEVAEEVLDRLEAVGLINDAEYAAVLVRTRFAEKGVVDRALRDELHRKGLTQYADDALSHLSADAKRERARELASRKLSTFTGVSRDAAWRRLTSMLARKGYAPEVCISIVEEVLSSTTDRASVEEGETTNDYF